MATKSDGNGSEVGAGPVTPAARKRPPPAPAEGAAGPRWNLSDELLGLEAAPDAKVRPGPDAPRRRERPAPARTAPASAPQSRERRLGALISLGLCSLAVLLQLASVLSSGSSRAGYSGLSAEASMAAVAPGGRIALEGEGAEPGAQLVLETRQRGRGWHDAAEAQADERGEFRVEGRVAALPGKVELRAREAGGATAAPVAVTVRPLRLASVGDVNLGDVPGEAIAAHGGRWPWDSAGAALRRADIAFANLESAVSERGTAFPKQYNFRGTPEALAGLRRHSGIDVLNLANNHVGDFGPAAMLDTVRGVRRLGMRAVGAGRDLRGALRPQVVERLGLRVAFVGFSNILPFEFAAERDRPGVAWATPEAVVEAVREARRRADVVVATFHWGIEKAPYETADQAGLAQVAADAGAQLVIGAHPHVLQPLRRAGAALVAYSLGNFVFGAQSTETSSTGILETDLTAEGVSSARWHPGRIAAGRPLLDAAPPQRLPVRDPDAMAAGLVLTPPRSG